MNRAIGWFLAAGLVLLAGCAPRVASQRTAEEQGESDQQRLARLKGYYGDIPPAVQEMLPRIRRHAAALAGLGPRQTGQEGCDRALAYVRAALARVAPQCQVSEFGSTVTVPLDRTSPTQLDAADEPHTHVVVSSAGGVERWPAYALVPNCIQACRTHPPGRCPLREPDRAGPFCTHCEVDRPVVDLRSGEWEDFRGKDLQGKVALLDFNSGDAWLRAAELGSAGALFVEPRQTTVFQADAKYLATLPLHFPRLYLRRADGLKLREAIGGGGDSVRVRLASRLRFRNVPARGLELTIPGKDRSYCYVLAGHVDARSIAPDLSYGGDETWGIAELIELTRWLAAHPPNCDVRVLFVSGHWQSRQTMRDYVAAGAGQYRRVGVYFKMAFGIDLVPAGRAVNVITESAWDAQDRGMYKSLGTRMFTERGWRDQIFEGLSLPRDRVELFGGVRSTMIEAGEGNLGNRKDRSAFVYAPRYPTAEEPWQGLGVPTFAFQTSRLARLAHNTPLDRFAVPDPQAADDQLRPQLELSLAVLRHLLDYPRKLLMRDRRPTPRRGRSWGGYAQVSGRILQWDRSIGWFKERLPNDEDGQALTTFLHAYPTHLLFTRLYGTRLRNYLNWPMNPSRGQHRELQSFMFQDLRMLERPHFQVKTVYASSPEIQYDVVAYAIDDAGRVTHATDYGVHGDGNKAFQSTDMDLVGTDTYIPVSMFKCGALELFGLIDPQRYDPGGYVFGSWYHSYSAQHADRGLAPHLKVAGVKTVDSHTDAERYGFTQYGPTAMVFLPADAMVASEVLLGSLFTNFAVLDNPDGRGRPRGYLLHAGETLRLTSAKSPTPRQCAEQLANLNRQRLEEFATYDVSSPLAKRYHGDSAAARLAGVEAQERGDTQAALAHFTRGWIFESQAYRDTLSLLVDVVATTVLYFVLLIPFSFLIERLVLPQRTPLRTALVSTMVFVTFATLLYFFHPGFKLAHNVVVTTTAFVIVVMTVPALVLLLLRGVAMLRAIGSKGVITARSEAESAGVVMAALSLAVSNMRRRRLRTALTLLTITVMVMALVLLTTSAAFDFRILEPSGAGRASFQGLQVYNARDRRHPLLTEMVEVYEGALAAEALVIRREGVNYGYDPDSTDNGAVHLEANGRRAAVPYFQVMDHRDDLLEYTIVPQVRGKEPKPGATFAFVVAAAGVPVVVVLAVRGVSAARARGLRKGLPPLIWAALVVGAVLLIIHLTVGYRATKPPPLDGDTPTQTRHVGRRLRLSDLMKQSDQAGRFFRPGEVDACCLPSNIAEKLGVGVGDTVTVMGLELKVVGIFAGRTKQEQDGKTVYVPGDIDRLTDLDGLPITAMRGAMFRQGEPDNPIHAPGSEIVIVPRAWIRKHRIFPALVHSMVIVPKGAEEDPGRITKLASRLAREILNVGVFSHYIDPNTHQSRSEHISMHTATHVKGSSMMLVILAVAVLMILAIMTGTVYERMREIHIFSSVGLSPRHVAGMFLIEALVYAGIAAVLGYFLGIISLKALLWHLKSTGQAQEFYPNYLGVFVVYSIGIAVLATVASSLYPIHLASKIVNPSEGRTWQLDVIGAEGGAEGGGAAPQDRWRVRLPFIATTAEEARAMMVYAYDYLVIHQGERSGRFVCESPPVGWSGPGTIELEMPIWLSPFERNLSQDTRLCAAPSPESEWWVLSLDLRRRSGPPYLWGRGATVFVNMLCKHLLRWRAATSEQETDCLRRAEAVFPARD